MRLFSSLATIAIVSLALMVPPHVVAEAQVQEPPDPPAQTPPPPARLPFPPNANIAFVDLQRVANQSIDGQAANQKVQELSEGRLTEIEARNLELQASQQKLQQNANVMSAEAQLQLQREMERLNIDIQRMTQDAEAEIGELQQTLQFEFQQKLVPAIDRIAVSRGLEFVFSVGDGGMIWANPALDITPDVIEELDSASQ